MCGVKNYNKKRDKICGVKRYKSARTEVCGVDLWTNAKSISFGLTKVGVSAGDGGCSACGTKCSVMGGAHLSCNERDHRGFGWHRTSCGMTCGITNTCRHPDNGIERYKTCENVSHGVDEYNECEAPEFGVSAYNTCADRSFGVIFNECRLPEFGLEKCLDQ